MVAWRGLVTWLRGPVGFNLGTAPTAKFQRGVPVIARLGRSYCDSTRALTQAAETRRRSGRRRIRLSKGVVVPAASGVDNETGGVCAVSVTDGCRCQLKAYPSRALLCVDVQPIVRESWGTLSLRQVPLPPLYPVRVPDPDPQPLISKRMYNVTLTD